MPWTIWNKKFYKDAESGFRLENVCISMTKSIFIENLNENLRNYSHRILKLEKELWYNTDNQRVV